MKLAVIQKNANCNGFLKKNLNQFTKSNQNTVDIIFASIDLEKLNVQ